LLIAILACFPCSSQLTHAVSDSVVVFNEIMYNAPGPDAGQEWIELHNQMAVNIDLSRWRISGGVDYTFPEGTLIAGGGYLVVSNFSGNLDNGGETIRLRNAAGRIMDELSYGDDGDWPVAADGLGPSLAKVLEGRDGAADNWRASTLIGGLPGAPNFPGVGQAAITPLISPQTPWRYRDDKVDLGNAWRGTGFNDSTWLSGTGPFDSASSGPGDLTVTNALVQRYRADDIIGLASGDTISGWNDTALGDGIAQHTTANGNPQYFDNVVEGHAVVRFDGLTDECRASQTPGINPTDSFTYFMVLRANGVQDDGGINSGSGDYMFDRSQIPSGNPLVSLKAVGGRFGYQTRYDDGSGLGGPVSSTAISLTDFQLLTLRRNRPASRFEIWVDGVLEATSPDNGFALTAPAMNIGRHATITANGFKGDVAELLMYRDVLSSDDLDAVFAYLGGRYGLGDFGSTAISAAATTVYFRASFDFTGSVDLATLELVPEILDGAVIYLNGAEIYRYNLPAGPVGYDTPALGVLTDPALPGRFDLSAADLLTGSNVVAVEVHKAISGTRHFFDLVLEAREESPDPRLPPVLALNEISAATSSNGFIELVNLSGAELDLDGYVLSTENDPAREVVFSNQTLSAGAVLAISTNGVQAGEKVLVLSPNRQRVLDARVATNRLRGRSSVFPGRWLFPDNPTPGLTNSFAFHTDIVINEILYHGSPIREGTNFIESAEEWIELSNRGGTAVDLSGWELDGGVRYTFPTGQVLAAGSYLVISNFSGSLSNRGELIALRDAANNPADEVHYHDDGAWPYAADGGGVSLELRNPWADNARAESWQGSDSSGQTSWSNYTFRSVVSASAVGPDAQWRDFVIGLLDSGEVLLDDLSVVADPDGAAVQLIENGSFSTGLSSWRPRGNHRHCEVVPDPDAPGNPVLRLLALGPTEHMHNQLDTTLANGESVNNGTVYEISFRARWVEGSNQVLTRLYFNRFPKRHLVEVPGQAGTPGAINSRYMANTGPTWSHFQHDPVVPDAGEPVMVSAEVKDPAGVDPASLLLWYRVGSGAWNSVPMQAVTNARYRAAIPGQAAASVVQFYVDGADNLGLASSFPAPGADGRALYKVQDGQASQNGLHTLRIMMTPEDLAFQLTNIHLMSNEHLGCTVIYRESEVYYDVGIRLKSSERGRVRDNRIGFKLRFQPDRLFRGIHRTIAIDRSEGQTVGQREILQDHLLNHAGMVPSRYNDLAKLIAPSPNHTSTAMLQLARYGNVFLDGQFSDGGDGDLFEYELIYYPRNADANGYKTPQSDGVVGTRLRDLGDDPENYRWNFLLKNNRARDDYHRLIEYVRTFDLSGVAFTQQADALIDTDQWLRTMAMAVLTGSGDSYPANSSHNAMFYFRPSDGKALYFPHDMDFSYSTTRSIFQNQDLSSFVNADPKYRRRYLGYLDDLMDTTWNTGYMQAWADHYGQLLAGQAFSSHLAFIGARAASARSQLESNVAPVTFAITSNGGSDFGVSAASYTLEGDAWVDIRTIQRAGDPVPLDISWVDKDSWAIEFPLLPGPNLIQLEGFDYQGQLAVTDSITLSNTGNLYPAGPGNLVVSEIMYHPAGTNDTEYLELQNISLHPIDIRDVVVSEAVAFTFAGTALGTLGPGETVLVVRNQAAFEQVYAPGLPIAGVFGPQSLANEGERLRISGTGGQTIRDFRYDDDIPWPTLPDGFGYSLELHAPAGNPDHSLASSWRAGITPGGTPGRLAGDPRSEWDERFFTPLEQADPAISGGVADPDADGLSNDLEYMLGNDPRSSASARLPTWRFDRHSPLVDLRFSRLPGARDLSFAVRGSIDLLSWFFVPAMVVGSPSPQADGSQEETWQLNYAPPFGSNELIYLRLEASAP
jgi:hypothetical protein